MKDESHFTTPVDDDGYDESLCWLAQSKALLALVMADVGDGSDAVPNRDGGSAAGSSSGSGSGESTVAGTAARSDFEAGGQSAGRVGWALEEAIRLHGLITKARSQLKDEVQKKTASENAEEELASGNYAAGIALLEHKLPGKGNSPLAWPPVEEKNAEYYRLIMKLANAHCKLGQHVMHLHCLLRAIDVAYEKMKLNAADFTAKMVEDPIVNYVDAVRLLRELHHPETASTAAAAAVSVSAPTNAADVAGLTKGTLLFLKQLETDKHIFARNKRNKRLGEAKQRIAKHVIPPSIARFRLAICELLQLSLNFNATASDIACATGAESTITGDAVSASGGASKAGGASTARAVTRHPELPRHLQLLLHWREGENDEAAETLVFLDAVVTKLELCHAELLAAQPDSHVPATGDGAPPSLDDADGCDSDGDADAENDDDGSSSDGESGSESDSGGLDNVVTDPTNVDAVATNEVGAVEDLRQLIDGCYASVHDAFVKTHADALGDAHDYRYETLAARVLQHRWRKEALENELPRRKRRGRWKTQDNGEADELEKRKQDVECIRKYIQSPADADDLATRSAFINRQALMGVVDGWWSYPLDMPDYTAAHTSMGSSSADDAGERAATLTMDARRQIYAEVTYRHARALIRRMHVADNNVKTKDHLKATTFTSNFLDCMECLEQQPDRWECWGFLARVFARMVYIRLDLSAAALVTYPTDLFYIQDAPDSGVGTSAGGGASGGAGAIGGGGGGGGSSGGGRVKSNRSQVAGLEAFGGDSTQYVREVQADLAKARRCFRYACQLANKDPIVSRSITAKANAGIRKDASNLFKAHGFLEFIVGSNAKTFALLGVPTLDIDNGTLKGKGKGKEKEKGRGKRKEKGSAVVSNATAFDDYDSGEMGGESIAELDAIACNLESEHAKLLDEVRTRWSDGPRASRVRAQRIFEMIAPDSAGELLVRHFDGQNLAASASDDDTMADQGGHSSGNGDNAERLLEMYEDEGDGDATGNDGFGMYDDDEVAPVRPWQQVAAAESAAAKVAAASAAALPTAASTLNGGASTAAASAATIAAGAGAGGGNLDVEEGTGKTANVTLDAMKTKSSNGAIAACKAIAALRMDEAMDADKESPAGLGAAIQLFKKVGELERKDEWQTHLVLGRTSALRGDPASVFLPHFYAAAKLLNIKTSPTAENCKDTPKMLLPRVEFHHQYHAALWESFSRVADVGDYPAKELQLIVESFRHFSGKRMEETNTRRLSSSELAEKVIDFIVEAMHQCITTVQDAKKCGQRFKNVGKGDDLPFRICLAKILFDTRVPIAQQPFYTLPPPENRQPSGGRVLTAVDMEIQQSDASRAVVNGTVDSTAAASAVAASAVAASAVAASTTAAAAVAASPTAAAAVAASTTAAATVATSAAAASTAAASTAAAFVATA